MASTYKGPVCFVGQDHEAADGHQLEGGWHYTVVEGPDGTDMPGKKLFLSDEGVFTVAKKGDEPHSRHHKELVIAAIDGNVGEPHDQESIDATRKLLDRLESELES